GGMREQLAGPRQQAVCELGPLDVGDVLDRRHRVEHLARGTLDRPRLGPGPALLAGLEIDRPQGLRLAGVALQRAAPREGLRRDLVALLVADRVAPPD